MDENKIYLTRDKTIWFDLEKKQVFDSDVPVGLQPLQIGVLRHLLENKEKFCSYAEIYGDVWYGAHHGDNVLITGAINKIKERLKEGREDRIKIPRGRTAGFTKEDFKNYDLTFVNTPGNAGGYKLYLGYDYVGNEILDEMPDTKDDHAYEAIRVKIANSYYEEYKDFDWQAPENKMKKLLMEVFTYPTFKDKDGRKHELKISETDNTYICAPNGFGKTTLLYMLLFLTNPSSELRKPAEQECRVEKLRDHYGIDDDYLALFLNLKNINTLPAFNKDEDLCKWLFYATHVDEKKIMLEDFRETVAHFNENSHLILILDGIDEVIKKKEAELSRDDLQNKIRLLTNADGICNNAKLIISSRPLTYENLLGNYKYLYMDSLVNQSERVKELIKNYAPQYHTLIEEYIYNDLYMKFLVTTPALLVEVMRQFLLKVYDEETGIEGRSKSKFDLIRDIIRETMMRFQEKRFFNYWDTDYDLIYERLAYISLLNDIENNKTDFAVIQDMVLDSNLTLRNKRKKEIKAEDISDAYEHFSLINSKEQYIEFLAPEIFRPFYLAKYMYKYYGHEENANGNRRWKMFESILKNKENKEEWLFDTLVFYFGFLHESLDPESSEYNAWIDYIVYKWENSDTSKAKELLSSRIKYLMDSDFVINSCLERILGSKEDLPKNEEQLKSILQEIRTRND